MYPTLVKFGSFEITTFGLMMFFAFVAAGWILTREFARYGLDPEVPSSMLVAAAIGGILGAKIYYAILFRDVGLLWSRSGLVWYGGLIGGTLACMLVIRSKRVDSLLAVDAAAPGLALGYAVGRIGCFLVGDDYGRPTDGPLGVAFPRGAPPTTAASLRDFGVRLDPNIPDETLLRVHPTQLYETAGSLVIFAILMLVARRPHRRGAVFALFLILAAIERFLVEILRAKDDRFFGPFTVAQGISGLIFVAGVTLLVRSRRNEQVAAL